MSSPRLAYTTDLTEEEGHLLAPRLPPGKPGGRPRHDLRREGRNGLQYGLRAGWAWRVMPHDRPHGQAVVQLFRAWR